MVFVIIPGRKEWECELLASFIASTKHKFLNNETAVFYIKHDEYDSCFCTTGN